MTEKKKSKWQIFASYYKPYKTIFILDMICAAMISFVDLAFPMITKYSLQSVLPEKRYKVFFLIIVALLLMYVFRMLMQYFVTYWGHYMGVQVEADMRKDVFSHIQKLSFRYFDKNRTGHLLSRITVDLFEITELAHHGPEDLMISAVMLIGSFILLFPINWQLSLLLFLLLPIIIIFTMKQRKKMSEASTEVKRKLAFVNGDIESSISGVRVSRAFVNEDFEREKFDLGNEAFKSARKIYFKVMAVFHSGMEFMSSLLYVAVLGFGGYLIMRGSLSVVDLIVFNLYVTFFLLPIKKIAAFMEQYTAGMAGFNRMQELMNTAPDIADKAGAVKLTQVKGDIAFDHVSFAYEKDNYVLRDVSFKLEAGRKIAIVGPSGGGKSTICQLIPRFYETSSGCISIDGKNIADLTLSSLRDNIGIVQQDVFLFATTIRENIRYGKLDADDEEIIAAAKKAEIHDYIISLENGYDTFVGERGIMLSGGQKQRISIARVFLKNPPILILDEATSALDTETELKIQASLNELAKGRSSIIIAHRLSTIRNADEIFYIDHDTIIEQGTHEELMQIKNGYYYNLYQAQFINH